jgi:hypothetical protein
MSTDKPELDIQSELVEFLASCGWLVEPMLADAFQTGLPDFYCHHPQWGERWVEVKRADNYTFTLRQRQKWPGWEASGVGIWILTAATEEQYGLLFKDPNWRQFWKPSFRTPTRQDVDAQIAELHREYEESQKADKDAPHEPAGDGPPWPVGKPPLD